jgi:hypothetical protein
MEDLRMADGRGGQKSEVGGQKIEIGEGKDY